MSNICLVNRQHCDVKEKIISVWKNKLVPVQQLFVLDKDGEYAQLEQALNHHIFPCRDVFVYHSTGNEERTLRSVKETYFIFLETYWEKIKKNKKLKIKSFLFLDDVEVLFEKADESDDEYNQKLSLLSEILQKAEEYNCELHLFTTAKEIKHPIFNEVLLVTSTEYEAINNVQKIAHNANVMQRLMEQHPVFSVK